MKYKAILFDLDGTLLDTIDDLRDSMNKALAKFGYPQISVDEAKSFVGSGVERFLELALPEGKENKNFDEALEFFKQDYSKNMFHKTGPYKGIMELLKTVKERGYKTAIVSNKFDKAVKELTPIYFENYIDYAVGESESERKKPAPDLIFKALELLEVEKDDAVYIGDSDVDANTALNANMDFIGVSWGFRKKELLYSLGAKVVIDSPDQLLEEV
ncbi:MAG: HAD family hydrolase [Tissierellales bacterium]